MKFFATLAACAMLAWALPAQADPRHDPTADYSAEAVAKTEGQPESISKLWYTKAKLRVDLKEEGQSMTVIMDRTTRKMTIYLHQAKGYQQEDLPPGEGDNDFATGTWKVAKIGEESVAGAPATKWSVNGKGSDGRLFKGFVWTTKENIQIKMEGESTEGGKTLKVSSELRALKVGPIEPSVFEGPKDYKLLPKN
ncbi:MAG: hypothetical protein KIT16_06305 [Rhodospirillaceae bacterium]|nr:hypothetical protein [Rhodospirillaceae bacterium]